MKAFVTAPTFSLNAFNFLLLLIVVEFVAAAATAITMLPMKLTKYWRPIKVASLLFYSSKACQQLDHLKKILNFFKQKKIFQRNEIKKVHEGICEFIYLI